MNCLIIDQAVLSYMGLKLKLESMGYSVNTLSCKNFKDYEKEFLRLYAQKDSPDEETDTEEFDFIFVSVYAAGDIVNFINNVLRHYKPNAKIIATYAKGEPTALPSRYIAHYDGILTQPYSESELRKVLLK